MNDPSSMASEVTARRDRRFPWLRWLNPRPLLREGCPIVTVLVPLGKTVPVNRLNMVSFAALCRGGRIHGPAGNVRQWFEARVAEDLSHGELISPPWHPWPQVGFSAATMVALEAVDALEIWTDAIVETARRTCELLDIYHGFLLESVLFDTWSISEHYGKLMYENPHRAAGEILHHRQIDLYNEALHAAAASHDWPMVLEVVRRLASDPRASSFQEPLTLYTLRAWIGLRKPEQALAIAQRALPKASHAEFDAQLRSVISASHALLNKWRDSYEAVEKVDVSIAPRAAYHRMIAFLHLGKLREATCEREHYFDHVGTDLYADLRFRALAKRLFGVIPPRM
ncbi:MAG: hypothetical protein ACOYM3_24555 [Terrimicrobiaceae bacterium]